MEISYNRNTEFLKRLHTYEMCVGKFYIVNCVCIERIVVFRSLFPSRNVFELDSDSQNKIIASETKSVLLKEYRV